VPDTQFGLLLFLGMSMLHIKHRAFLSIMPFWAFAVLRIMPFLT
jgi:hypothetical protein